MLDLVFCGFPPFSLRLRQHESLWLGEILEVTKVCKQYKTIELLTFFIRKDWTNDPVPLISIPKLLGVPKGSCGGT